MPETKPQKIKARVQIYTCGGAPLGEPTEQRLKQLKFTEKMLRTGRNDYRQFVFVSCRLNDLPAILVIKYAADKIERLSCQSLKNWDNQSSFDPVPQASK